MGKKGDDVANLLGSSYPGSWTIEITSAYESRLRQVYSIPSSVKLRFGMKDTGATIREDVHEVYVYEDMFKASFRLSFPRIARELLHYLQIAPHQLTPNAWRILFACIILWPKVLGEGKNLSLREFLKIYELKESPDSEYIFNFQGRQRTKLIWLTGYSDHKGWRKRFFFA
jgi:hypothetical protein